MHDPNVYLTILGGVLRGFWTPFLDLGAGSAIFWHLEMGTFAKISNRPLSVVYGSITLKFFGGALGTSLHQWFDRGNKIKKKCFFGTPYSARCLEKGKLLGVELLLFSRVFQFLKSIFSI